MGHVRWNCLKDRALFASSSKGELSKEEKAFFDAFRTIAVELENRERTPAEDEFFKQMGYLKNLGEISDGPEKG